MKKIISTFLLFTGICFAQGEWKLLQPDLPNVIYLFDIIFTDSQTGYFLGTSDLVRTTNAGDDWEVLNTPAFYPYNSFYFRNHTGWLVAGGKLFKSIDAGNSWNEIINSPGAFAKIYFYDESKGWAILDNKYIYGTDDGGTNWTLQFTSGNDSLFSFFFIDNLNGWCGRNLKTTDGGNSWEIYSSNLSSSPSEINFLNGNLGFCRVFSQLYRTTNGGLLWEWIDIGISDSYWIRKIMPIDSTLIYVTALRDAWDEFRKSTDGGNTWVSISPPDEFFRVYTSAITTDTTIFYSNQWPLCNFILRKRTTNDKFYVSNRTDGTTFRDILPLNNDTVLAAGEAGKIYKTTDGGVTWERKMTPVTGLIRKLFLIDGVIWGAVDDWTIANIIKSTDLGETWENNYSSQTLHITDVWFLSANLGFVTCSDGYILKTTDGGITWNQILLGSSTLNEIFFYNQTGWICDNIYTHKTTDSGETWINAADIPNHLYYFKNELEGNAVNFQTYDGGESWQWNGTPNVEMGYYSAMTFAGDTGFIVLNYPDWVVSDFGSIWGSENFGGIWDTVLNRLFWRALYSVRMLDSRHGWICGQYGTIMYYDDTTYIPVELNSLTAKIFGDKVSLNWTTATETNNRGFDVERQVSSKEYGVSSLWEKIGFVEGNGTSTSIHSYSFTDKNVSEGKYSYRLKQIDFDGSFKYSNEVEVELNPKLEFALEQNYPNPFNPITTIKYSIPKDGYVSLKVYNTLGQQIAELVNGLVKAGSHQVAFSVGKLSSGVYYYRIEAGENVSVKKMVVLK